MVKAARGKGNNDRERGGRGGEQDREKNKGVSSARSQEQLDLNDPDDDIPSEDFWKNFFSEENFRGKTLGEFLDDVAHSPSPTTARKSLALFNVPRRELFYKEEDLRCFRRDGTYIGDYSGDDDDDKGGGGGGGGGGGSDEQEQALASASLLTPAMPQVGGNLIPREREPNSDPLVPAVREGGPVRVRWQEDLVEPEEQLPPAPPLPLPGGVAGSMGMGKELEGLDLGAAVFAAASAEYGNALSSSSSASSAGLLPRPVMTSSDSAVRVTSAVRTAKRSSEGSGKNSEAFSGGSISAASSSSSRRSGGGGGSSSNLGCTGRSRSKEAGRNSVKGGRGKEAARKSDGVAGVAGAGNQKPHQVGRRRHAAAGAGGDGEGSGGGAGGGRSRGSVSGASAGAGSVPATNNKRRRVTGGVLAPTSSSIGKTVAPAAALTRTADIATDGIKDPMQKKLLQFRKQKASGASINANAPMAGATVNEAAVHTVAAAGVGRGRPATSRSGGDCGGRTSVASGTAAPAVPRNAAVAAAAAAAASRTTTTSRALTPSTASLGGTGSGGGGGVGYDATPGSGVFRAASTEAKENFASNAARPAVTAAAAATRGPLVPSTNRVKTLPKTIAKPVTTVKRSVHGTTAAATAPAAGGRVLRARGVGQAPAGASKRKAPAVLSTNVTDRKRRSGSRKGVTKADPSDAACLSFDDDLKAKLEEHNRGVTKGRHTYEPSKGRVKDWKKWESRTGKKYYSLNPDEKADANREILAMLAAETEA